MKYICVFAGTSESAVAPYAKITEKLGKLIVAAGYGLIYGGAKTGLMNVIAESVLEAGGEVIGVVTPEIRLADVIHPRVTIIEEATYSQRKDAMEKKSAAFIVLPGGYGTLDEMMNLAINNQFANWGGLDIKALTVLNANNFFDGTMAQLDRSLKDNFMTSKHREIIYFENTPEKVMEYIKAYKSPAPDRSRWWEVASTPAALSGQFGLLQTPTIEMTEQKFVEADAPKP